MVRLKISFSSSCRFLISLFSNLQTLFLLLCFLSRLFVFLFQLVYIFSNFLFNFADSFSTAADDFSISSCIVSLSLSLHLTPFDHRESLTTTTTRPTRWRVKLFLLSLLFENFISFRCRRRRLNRRFSSSFFPFSFSFCCCCCCCFNNGFLALTSLFFLPASTAPDVSPRAPYFLFKRRERKSRKSVKRARVVPDDKQSLSLLCVLSVFWCVY